MSLHCNHANGGCRLPGVMGFIGKKCEKLAERIAEKHSLSKGDDLVQGQNGHFQYVNTWWKWYQQNGLDNIKKWALESPHLELWTKSYKGLTARDLFVKIYPQTVPWVKNRKSIWQNTLSWPKPHQYPSSEWENTPARMCFHLSS